MRKIAWIGALFVLFAAGGVAGTLVHAYFPFPLWHVPQPPEQGTPSPYCVLQHVYDREFDDHMRLTVWDLRVHGIKKLKVQLLRVESGKSTPVQSADHEWNQWSKDKPEITGKVIYVLRTEKGKMFPSLSVDLKSDSCFSIMGHAWVNDAVAPVLGRDLNKENRHRSFESSPGRLFLKSVLLATDVSIPQKEIKGGGKGTTYLADGTLKTLLEQTEGGAALVVSLDWAAE